MACVFDCYNIFALLSGVIVEYSFTFIYIAFPAIVGTNSTFRGLPLKT